MHTPTHTDLTAKVFLTEGEGVQSPQLDVALSMDATVKKNTATLPLKPGSSYTVEVPPRQEAVVVKFKTFGRSKLLNLLPGVCLYI